VVANEVAKCRRVKARAFASGRPVAPGPPIHFWTPCVHPILHFENVLPVIFDPPCCETPATGLVKALLLCVKASLSLYCSNDTYVCVYSKSV